MSSATSSPTMVSGAPVPRSTSCAWRGSSAMGSSRAGTRPLWSATRPSASGGIALPPAGRVRGVRRGLSMRPSPPPPRRGASPMPDPRLGRILASLLPDRIAADVFEPAWEDGTRIAYFIRRQRAESLLGRATIYAGYLFLAVVVFLDCWRLALVAVLRSPPADRRRAHPIISAEPRQTERLHMVLYLDPPRVPSARARARVHRRGAVDARTRRRRRRRRVRRRRRRAPAPAAVPGRRPTRVPEPSRQAHRHYEGVHCHRRLRGLVSRQGAFESLAAYGRGQTSIIDRDDPYRVDLLGAAPGLLDCFAFVPCSVARSSPRTLARVHRR